ncbi:hypothetical protein PsW64_05056 [Pseudovibrio sp. W64]|nr:hypothetical protein PsW64_05056 [Pseudovibrio sp. W64]
MTFLPLIFTVNTLRMRQLYWFGMEPARYGTALEQENEQ